MPMRTNCRHYETRSYGNGETVRKCNLDLAPEAPWRCPESCPEYSPRRLDAAWDHGSLGVRDFAEEPDSLGDDDSIAALLDAAEDIVNAAGPDILSELDAEQGGKKRRRPRMNKKTRTKKRKKGRKR
ncbi:MAG: hypothetical protein VX971_03680 [Actinomycetota bacterium]|nr:hypothetical protein [Acidimicrobiales bacterium]MEC9269185.1 hypothetical protein [Actinomycetota bacterium]MEC9315773.1 hypothetical protein [Actinomycetota bacterium]MEC9338713.1 hypothetical protein [Actinomycetota bacterium]MED6304236.1 hypothetical protein [Actinomycetota bacterium]